jgi:hypothetical protein
MQLPKLAQGGFQDFYVYVPGTYTLVDISEQSDFALAQIIQMADGHRLRSGHVITTEGKAEARAEWRRRWPDPRQQPGKRWAAYPHALAHADG